MLKCTPKDGWPVHQYLDPAKLDQFLLDNGGNGARIEVSGIAWTESVVKGESRTMFIKPTSWVRVMGPGQFSACSDKAFHETYNLYNDANI